MQHRYIRSTLHIAVQLKSVVEESNILASTFRNLVKGVDRTDITQALTTIGQRLSHLQLHVVVIWESPNVRYSCKSLGPCAQDTGHQKGSDLRNENAIAADVGIVALLSRGHLHVWNQARIVHSLVPGCVDARKA